MINFFQRTLSKIASQPKFRFTTLKYPFSGSLKRLNNNNSMNFCFQMQKNHVINKYGMVQLGENVGLAQVCLQWQEDILKLIKTFKDNNSDSQIETIQQFFGFLQTYMEYWMTIPDTEVSIDNNILDFAENLLNIMDFPLPDHNNTNMQWALTLNMLQVQIKYIRHFESMKISKIEYLNKRYKYLCEKNSQIVQTSMNKEKNQCYLNAYSHFLYLAKFWSQFDTIDAWFYESDSAEHAIVQLFEILEEFQLVEVQKEFAFFIVKDIIKKIELVYQKFKMSLKLDFQLRIASKMEMSIEQFKCLLSQDDYVQTKLNCIMKYLKLGYMEKALKSALDLYDLRFHIKSKQAVMLYYSQLYYCLRKTENTNYDLDLLIEEIDPNKGMNKGDLKIYQQLVCIQQLHNLIQQQKYHQIESILDKIFQISFEKEIQNHLFLFLLCETIIFNSKIPYRLHYIKFLFYLCDQNFADDTFYCERQRDKHVKILSLIVKNNEEQFVIFSKDIL